MGFLLNNNGFSWNTVLVVTWLIMPKWSVGIMHKLGISARQKGFFDIVTWTGNWWSGKNISHRSLGSASLDSIMDQKYVINNGAELDGIP